MVAFHFAWASFFCAWISTFSPAALLPVIRESLNLTSFDIGNAGIAALCGAIAGRIAMGTAVDRYGPRYGICCCLGLTSPAVFLIALAQTPTQFLVASMFNVKVVGFANACGAGLVFMTITTMLLAQDCPDGNYVDLKASGVMKRQSNWAMWRAAVTNYRTWVMMATYGYCFGVELTMNNLLSQYMFDQFSLGLQTAGLLASVFGLTNILSRPSGGLLSDYVAGRWGMRGRLWALWVTQTLAGLMCMLLGLVSRSLPATMAVLVMLSFTCQQSAGLSFGVVPFVSKRSTGLVAGFVGAGGNVGASLNQAIFFTYAGLSTPQGFLWLGVLSMAVTALYALVYFPMWGGMLSGPKEGLSEEAYYLAEFTPEEIAQGLHTASLRFAFESRSQRSSTGRKDASVRAGAAHSTATPAHIIAVATPSV
ncbi:major facilitator superfamily domain-containing protein [Scenedesmus sp. NREL 46B-D3]|nr:major facilitator superfamily domain-containing protein [Scenedesmus sp. NREL 46B-D3]